MNDITPAVVKTQELQDVSFYTRVSPTIWSGTLLWVIIVVLCARLFFFFFGINSGQKILTLIFEMTFHSLICLTSRRSKFNKSFKLQSSWSIAIFNLAESQSFYHFLNFSSSRAVKSSNIYSNKSFKNITAVLAIFPVNTNRLLSFLLKIPRGVINWQEITSILLQHITFYLYINVWFTKG